MNEELMFAAIWLIFDNCNIVNNMSEKQRISSIKTWKRIVFLRIPVFTLSAMFMHARVIIGAFYCDYFGVKILQKHFAFTFSSSKNFLRQCYNCKRHLTMWTRKCAVSQICPPDMSWLKVICWLGFSGTFNTVRLNVNLVKRLTLIHLSVC